MTETVDVLCTHAVYAMCLYLEYRRHYQYSTVCGILCARLNDIANSQFYALLSKSNQIKHHNQIEIKQIGNLNNPVASVHNVYI